ncbi:hypothetical protein PN498_06830 [Oscillatoria sp. CS-180]|uniref:hypothetical protein n=1 Tax=Oscillatoria sp. CS-180 TaxID=3021720 RepID=UPI002330736F|nr:hypothetical protein [Oscillatoria sp. CS-180]MDB9525696.1 hypothetical protein [Oscillatoria sp. CS-180]
MQAIDDPIDTTNDKSIEVRVNQVTQLNSARIARSLSGSEKTVFVRNAKKPASIAKTT